MVKHNKSKADLLRQRKSMELRAKYAEEIGFNAAMHLALYTLATTFGMAQDQLQTFIEKVYENDNNDLGDMRNYLLNEVGICVELPRGTAEVGEEFETVRI